MVEPSSPAASSSESAGVDNSPPKYNFEYEFIDVVPFAETKSSESSVARGSKKQESSDEDAQTYEFRLFATTKGSTTINAASSKSKTKTTIKLPPTPEEFNIPISEGHFLRSARPSAHYFTASLPETKVIELRGEYAAAAVASRDILKKASAQKWPGTALPWRVTHIRIAKADSTSGSAATYSLAPTVPAGEGSGRKKPNKKRRIQLRKLLIARTAAAAAKVRQTETAEEKEKALREKKAAKNRKVQLKRREKERRKKAQAKIAGDTDGGQLSEQPSVGEQ